jgi:hypothetical protein
MTLLAVTDLPLAGVVTNLDPTMLQMLLDSAEAEIISRRGPVTGPLTDVRLGFVRLVGLSRPCADAGITTITEIASDGTQQVLDSTDWLIYPNMRHLVRLPYGTHGANRWDNWVQVVYTPRDDTAQRKRVQLGLVKLDLAYNGFNAQATQNESRSALADYYHARNALLNSFALTDGRVY